MSIATQVSVVIIYQSRQDTTDRAVRELARLIATVVQAEPDCFAISMHQDVTDPTRILLFEQWSSRAAFEGDHLSTPHLTAFRERAPQLFAGPPEISFWGEVARADPEA